MFRRSLILSIALSASLPMAALAQAPLQKLQLPATVSFPEGTTFDPGSNSLYAGNAENGALVRVDATTGVSTLVTPAGQIVPAGGAFPAMLGMKLDPKGRLWLAGGNTGLQTVVNPADGKIIKQVKVPTAPKSLLNDLVIIGNAAYTTDTFVPILWRQTMNGDAIGEIEPWLDLKNTPITFADGPNLNGIAATPDGKAIIVIQMNKGLLFRIDIATKRVTSIDVGGADLTGSDGLVITGQTLYVVRQWAGEIVTVALDPTFDHGTVISYFKDPGLAYPATATIVGSDLVLVNTQFNTRDDHTTVRPFTLVKVPLSRLQGE
jgi:sugar lactone lactonase YvrE